jgi:cell division protein FtsB
LTVSNINYYGEVSYFFSLIIQKSDKNCIFASNNKSAMVMDENNKTDKNGILEFIKNNKILLAILFFVVFILFIDDNNLFVRITQKREIRELKTEIEAYKKQIERDEKLIQELDDDSLLKEHIAREKYFMRQEDEDIFIYR